MLRTAPISSHHTGRSWREARNSKFILAVYSLMEGLEGCSGVWRGCCEEGGTTSPHLLTDPSCLLLSLQQSPLACPHPSTCTAADLYSFFFWYVVMTGQTAVLSRRVSCFTSVSLSTSCSLISVWNCFLEGI